MKDRTGSSVLWLSLPLAVLVAINSVCGLFRPATYARDNPSWAALGMGGDAFNLLLVIPVVLVTALLAHRGSVAARLVWMGALVYLLYGFVICCFAVHFNAIFLAYCGGLGLSFYGLVTNLRFVPAARMAALYAPRAPRKTIAISFLVMSFLVTFGYLKELIPASIAGQPPESAAMFGLLTNPAHVIDLCFLVPALVYTAIALFRRHAAGFLLAPILLAFNVFMGTSLEAMFVAGRLKGFGFPIEPVLLVGEVIVVCGVLLYLHLRRAVQIAAVEDARLCTSPRAALWLSVPLAVLVVISDGAGLLWPSVFARETPVWAAAGMAGGVVNLALVVPVLLASAALAWRGSLAARLVWMGTLGFLVYDFVFYCLAAHFNSLFLAYCGVLGLSANALAMTLRSVPVAEIAARYGSRAPRRALAAVFALLAAAPALGELKEIIPAQLTGRVPAGITESGLFTNPVHVLDLALLLPAFGITAFLLLRRRPLAYVLAPSLLALASLMGALLAGIILIMGSKGFPPDPLAIALLAALAAALAALAAVYFRAGRRAATATAAA
jgi:hypothetical protein